MKLSDHINIITVYIKFIFPASLFYVATPHEYVCYHRELSKTLCLLLLCVRVIRFVCLYLLRALFLWIYMKKAKCSRQALGIEITFHPKSVLLPTSNRWLITRHSKCTILLCIHSPSKIFITKRRIRRISWPVTAVLPALNLIRRDA